MRSKQRRRVAEACWNILSRGLVTTVRCAAAIGGPVLLSVLLIPWIVFDVLRRLGDYWQFKRIRETLPPHFWRGCGPWWHYLRMIIRWQESLAVCLLEDRFRQKSWRRRIKLRGMSLEQLRAWGSRPVVLAYLHTGGFVLLQYWLRSVGVRTAALANVRPRILIQNSKRLARKAEAESGSLRGTEVFFRRGGLRKAIQFLVPGNVLAVALDGPSPSHFGRMGAEIRLNNGAVRLATLCNALVVPVSIRQPAWLTFEIWFGVPVPEKMIADRDLERAMQHLADELWKNLSPDPCSINWTTLEAYAPQHLIRARTPWP